MFKSFIIMVITSAAKNVFEEKCSNQTFPFKIRIFSCTAETQK